MKRINAKTRAAALADLHAGEQPAIVAERHGLEMGTVRQWKARYVTEVVTQRGTIEARPSLERQHQQIGELVLDLLAAKLKASAEIAKAASDPDWRAKQSGSELAAFGEWLDATAFAIGDRLAGGRNRDDATSGSE